jgi:hypothetical protein
MSDFQQQQDAGNGRVPGGGGMGEQAERLGSDAQQLWSDARGAVDGLNETLDIRGRVERNPYGMVAAAVGIGYVLGGGLFTPLTLRIVRLGVRLAALPFVKDELFRMAEAAMDGARAAGNAASEATGQGPTQRS